MRWINEELMMMVEALVRQDPGIWTAKLCRLINGLPETEASIIFCGLCADYANLGKRARAKFFRAQTPLPGFDRPYQLHEPCTCCNLKKLQYLLRRLEEHCDLIYGEQKSVIPDIRQPRGWDYGTRWYGT